MAFETVSDLTGSVQAAFVAAAYIIFGNYFLSIKAHQFNLFSSCRRRHDYSQPIHSTRPPAAVLHDGERYGNGEGVKIHRKLQQLHPQVVDVADVHWDDDCMHDKREVRRTLRRSPRGTADGFRFVECARRFIQATFLLNQTAGGARGRSHSVAHHAVYFFLLHPLDSAQPQWQWRRFLQFRLPESTDWKFTL